MKGPSVAMETKVEAPPAPGQPCLVSIIVPSFNQGRFIADTLDSILAQTHRPLEILVIDGGSTDETVEVLRRYAARHECLRWISEPDEGVADAVNKGLALANGEIAGIQSSDDRYYPWAIEEIVRVMNEHPDCGFAYGELDCMDGDGRFLGRGDPVPKFSWEAFFAIGLCIPQSSIFFRTALGREVGGWNSKYYSCDLDFWLKILLRTRALKVDRVLSIWRIYAEQRTRPDKFPRIWRDYWQMIDDCTALKVAPRRVRRLAKASRHTLAFNINPRGTWFLRWHALCATLRHPTFWLHVPRARLFHVLPELRALARFSRKGRRLLEHASPRWGLRRALKKLGVRIRRMSVEERRYLRGYDDRVPLPPDADERLRLDHPRLRELERRYAAFDSPVCRHTQWRDSTHRTRQDLRYFRGDNEYVWQYLERKPGRIAAPDEMRLRFYLYAQYVREQDARGLLGSRLTEDGQFGCFHFEYPKFPVVSRDLLDSVNEISFLDRRWNLFERIGCRVLDVGAGYGRLAHRMLTAVDGLARYSCVDAVPRSTYLCEYYLRHRNLLDGDRGRAAVIPLDELDRTLTPGTIDLAINIHSFSEMSHEAVAAWIRTLVDLGVPWLFVIPNEPDMLSKERDGVRREYRGLIERAGYRLAVTEPTIRDADVRQLYGTDDRFFLFERA